MSIPTPNESVRIKTNEKLTAQELKEFMNLNGISNKEFSEILGVSPQAITLWVTGQRDFSITNSRLVKMFTKYPNLMREF